MSDYLSIIDQIVAQHHALMGQIGQVGAKVNDLEALFSLQKAYSAWSQSSMDTLIEKQRNLEQIRSSLGNALMRHFGFEERYLPPMLGEILLKWLVMEHHGILRQFDEAQPVFTVELTGKKQEEILIYKLHVQQAVSQLCQAVEQHLNKEEMMLQMLRTVLEKEEARSG
ncbi:MAG: hypothetical protein HYX83_03570 [Chloroflexi bacterium]|nr:hypothetical protein [Chloroflexota bacterium]